MGRVCHDTILSGEYRARSIGALSSFHVSGTPDNRGIVFRPDVQAKVLHSDEVLVYNRWARTYAASHRSDTKGASSRAPHSIAVLRNCSTFPWEHKHQE